MCEVKICELDRSHRAVLIPLVVSLLCQKAEREEEGGGGKWMSE